MIRKALERDLPELMQIYNDAILHTTATFDTETKDLADRREWFVEHEKDPYLILVEESEKGIAGYASLSSYRERKAFDPTVEISVYIREDCRGQGIGENLMRAVLASAQENPKIHTVISLITSDNEHSIYLHQKLGFVFCGKIDQAGYKFGRWMGLNCYQIIYD
jgi:phosphinothricin acetyltransferase